jgi:hypothetical protein
VHWHYRLSRYCPRSHLPSGSSAIEGIESSLDSGLRLWATVVTPPACAMPCDGHAPRYALLIMTKTPTHTNLLATGGLRLVAASESRLPGSPQLWLCLPTRPSPPPGLLSKNLLTNRPCVERRLDTKGPRPQPSQRSFQAVIPWIWPWQKAIARSPRFRHFGSRNTQKDRELTCACVPCLFGRGNFDRKLSPPYPTDGLGVP